MVGKIFTCLTLRVIDIDNVIDDLPNYRRLVTGKDFDFEQERLKNNDMIIDRSSDDMIQMREDLKVDNPYFNRFSMGAGGGALSCGAFLGN